MTCRLVAARAAIAVELEQPDPATAAATEAIEVCRSFGRLKYETVARLALGSTLLKAGRAEEAADAARAAVECANRLSHPPTSWTALALLARTSYAAGNDDAASAAFAEANARIASFASNLSEAHRTQLLSAPHVRDIQAAVV
jgi:predicted Zn-dependent protease